MSVTQKVRIALVGAEDAIKAVHAHLVSAGEHFNDLSHYKAIQLLDKLETAFIQAVSDAEKALGLRGIAYALDPATSGTSAAERAYAAYAAVTGNKNFRGEEMPQFNDLPDLIKKAWQAAIGSVGHEPDPAPGTEAALMAGDPSIPSVDNKGPALVADVEIIPAKPADSEPTPASPEFATGGIVPPTAPVLVGEQPSGETLIPVEVAQAATSGTLTQEIPGEVKPISVDPETGSHTFAAEDAGKVGVVEIPAEVLDVNNPGPALVDGKPVDEGGIVAKDEAAVAALVDLVKEVDVPDPGETQTITAADVGELKL